MSFFKRVWDEPQCGCLEHRNLRQYTGVSFPLQGKFRTFFFDGASKRAESESVRGCPVLIIGIFAGFQYGAAAGERELQKNKSPQNAVAVIAEKPTYFLTFRFLNIWIDSPSINWLYRSVVRNDDACDSAAI